MVARQEVVLVVGERCYRNMSTERLIIFTRYPEPGKVKTRLHCALGEVGSANLHRQMTERTIERARQLRAVKSIEITVYFTPSDRQQQTIDWLGTDLDYRVQEEGDLGAKMAQACDRSFQAGSERVVLIGTDCPGINVDLLQLAFERLLTSDLVIGPAIDGGYYLIGLHRFIPELFIGIEWGIDRVFAQTMAIARQLNLVSAELLTLADIDRAEDLAIWQAMQ
jgi:uncharacterized protein